MAIENFHRDHALFILHPVMQLLSAIRASMLHVKWPGQRERIALCCGQARPSFRNIVKERTRVHSEGSCGLYLYTYISNAAYYQVCKYVLLLNR